jgi:RNA polymerase sigma factor for flagellar operon FliA
MEEFYQLLDETKSVSLVDLEGVWKAVRKGPELPDNELPEILLDEKVRDPFLALHFAELQDIMVKAIDALPDKEKLLISLYYYEELTMKEIGQIMGYTESRISQLHTQAMFRLRAKLRDYFQAKEE